MAAAAAAAAAYLIYAAKWHDHFSPLLHNATAEEKETQIQMLFCFYFRFQTHSPSNPSKQPNETRVGMNAPTPPQPPDKT
jgi:hypothetical protein